MLPRQSPQAVFRRHVRGLLLGAATLLVLCFVTLSYYCYWADSEIWGITLARRLGSFEAENVSLFIKLSFYGLLHLLYFIPGSNVDLFNHARLVFCVIGLANVYLTWRLAWALLRDRQIAFLAVILLVGSSVYMNQGFRVRSDIFSLFWHLVIMNWIVAFSRGPRREHWLPAAAFLLFLNLCMLTTTPKAVYFLAAQTAFAFAWSRSLAPERRRLFLRVALPSFFLPVLAAGAFLLVSSFFSTRGGSNRIFVGYWAAWVYVRDAFLAWDPSNIDSEKFFFVRRLAERNLELVALIATATVAGAIECVLKRGAGVRAALGAYAFVLLAAAATYNDYLPFFLASILPVLCIGAASYIETYGRLLVKISRGNARRYATVRVVALLGLAAYSLGKGVFFFQENIFLNSNLKQRAAIDTMEKYLRQFPGAQFYDVIGTMPRTNRIFKFAGPGQEAANQRAMAHIARIKPDLIMYVRKASLLEPGMTDLLNADYVDLGYGIHGRAVGFELERATKTKIHGSEYFRVPVAPLLNRLEDLFPDIDSRSVYIHLWHRDFQRREGAERVLYSSPRGNAPVPIGSSEFRAEWLHSGGTLLVPADIHRGAISIYPPIRLPYESPMLFVFAFDAVF